MAHTELRETDLYAPIKTLLERQGYVVKGEVGAVDLMAIRGNEAPLLIELKTGFSLSLFHQGVARQAITDHVYIAVPRKSGRAFQTALSNNINLCRRLGLGLMTVRLRDAFVEIHVDPGPYKPRKSKSKTARLLREFERLSGDPNTGGSTRTGLITAYRQDALRCVGHLLMSGASRPRDIAQYTGVSRARAIMADNHYGWFERVQRGVYDLSPQGRKVQDTYVAELCALQSPAKS